MLNVETFVKTTQKSNLLGDYKERHYPAQKSNLFVNPMYNKPYGLNQIIIALAGMITCLL